MRTPIRVMTACAVALMFAAGCSKTEAPGRTSSTSPPTSTPAPAPDAAPKVAPDVPKGAQAPTPAPGQANDHSSPAFKAGGKNDPSK